LKTKKERHPDGSQTGWIILRRVQRAVRMAAALNDTTCQQIVNEMLVRQLTAMGCWPPPRSEGRKAT